MIHHILCFAYSLDLASSSPGYRPKASSQPTKTKWKGKKASRKYNLQNDS